MARGLQQHLTYTVLPMVRKIDDLTVREAFELQVYLAPITREFGCVGVGWQNMSVPQEGRNNRVVSFERRWQVLNAKLEHPSELSNLFDEMIHELRKANAA
jgi:hypothetical protein